jgi:hypothetical protein
MKKKEKRIECWRERGKKKEENQMKKEHFLLLNIQFHEKMESEIEMEETTGEEGREK